MKTKVLGLLKNVVKYASYVTIIVSIVKSVIDQLENENDVK